MKITLANASQPFTGSIIEICNLVAGRERFRIQQVPLLGSILWDENKQVEIEKPFDGEKLEKETGVAIELHWFESSDITKDNYPKRLGKIYIGCKWTGPLFWIEIDGDKKVHVCWSRGNFGSKFASGGNWSDLCFTEDGQAYRQPDFDTLAEALNYRFNRNNQRRSSQTRLFTESVELRDHVETVLKSLGLL